MVRDLDGEMVKVESSQGRAGQEKVREDKETGPDVLRERCQEKTDYCKATETSANHMAPPPRLNHSAGLRSRRFQRHGKQPVVGWDQEHESVRQFAKIAKAPPNHNQLLVCM